MTAEQASQQYKANPQHVADAQDVRNPPPPPLTNPQLLWNALLLLDDVTPLLVEDLIARSVQYRTLMGVWSIRIIRKSVSGAALRQLVPPRGWGNPAGRVWARPPALYLP